MHLFSLYHKQKASESLFLPHLPALFDARTNKKGGGSSPPA
ncbi:hypothetical protein B4113_3000 [Geobacillus sp. B4113_201601]|nr:hypothetical protein B4113_3000 [Geobacillus sp. B4113_201601]